MDTSVLCDAGPDTGAAVVVGATSVVVGRSPTADLTIHDAAAELHHLLLEPAGESTVRVIQLSGRAVARIGDRPLDASAVVPVGGVVTFGASRLRVGDRRGVGWTPTPGVADLLAPAGPPRPCRVDDGTMFRVHVGVADETTAVVTDLEPGVVVQLAGPGAAGVARSFVVQLAMQVPADRLAITVAGASGWLPDGVRFPQLQAPAAGEHHIVFAADPAAGSLELPALRARLGVSAATTVVVLDDRAAAPNPNLPGARLCLGALGRGRWAPGPDVTGSLHVHAAAVTTDTVVRVASRVDDGLRAADRPRVGAAIGWSAPVELLASGRPVDTIEVVGAWRRATGRPTLWLGRHDTTALWLQLGGPVVVVGDDATRRREVLATYAAGLALEHAPAALGLVVGEGVATPGSLHVVGAPLAPGRLGHELARPHADGGRATVLVADDALDEAATTVLDDGIGTTIARSSAGGRSLIIGVRPGHPWVSLLLGDPTATVVVTGIGELATARHIADSRATRLAPDQVMVRTPGEPFRVAALPRLDDRARPALTATLAHAAALTATPGAAVVRSCQPCPDDDSPWARPSSDPSSATMLVPLSSSG